MASPTSTNTHAIRHRLIEGSYYSGCHLTSGRSGPQSGEVTQLVLPDDVVFTCQQSGACCRNDWLIGVEDSARARLEAVDWTRLSPPLPPGPKFRPLPFALPGGERATFARRPDGACVFLEPDERCGIHTRLGARGKPQVCREFPYSFVDTPDGVAVGVSFACTAVRAHHGHSLSEQQAEIREVLAGSTRVRRLPDPLALYSSVDITWAQYRPIEAALLALLGHSECTLPTALLAGSVLISLCVGLSQVEARARREGRAPTETLVGGLAQLEADRYRRVIEVATQARYPRRPRLTPLAPLYTWLEFSRRHPSRLGLVWALYRNFFRFRRGRGRLRDWITGGAPFDIAAVQAVVFDASAPEIGAFLREYWRHVIFRKTLTPLHGVFRGYQTMLALYAFTKWAAKLQALRGGRTAVTIGDVKEAVRLIEQRFVLHARFADVFTLSPALTVMADRLFQDPAFVRGAVLEPEHP
jgi:Fe-S-cluster containining protein